MTPSETYLTKARGLIDAVAAQSSVIATAADWFAGTIGAGRMVHLFGSGHSRIMVEEMWPRYGSFPGFNPIVELSLSFHNLVVGANGQRQAMFLENVSGLAERILRNYALDPRDTALVVSSSGCNIVPIEMAEQFQQRGVRVVALVSRAHAEASTSRRPDGKKLTDFADLIRAVSRGGGLAKLPAEERRQLPAEIVTEDPAYEQIVTKELSIHMAVDPAKLQPMFEAQVSRDEAMAAGIVAARRAYGEKPRTAVVILGAGHMRYGLGTPARVTRRDPGIVERLVILTESGQLRLTDSEKAASRDVDISHDERRAVGRPPADFLRVLPRPPSGDLPPGHPPITGASPQK